MKKIAIMLLSAMVIFSFVACNNSGLPAVSGDVYVKYVDEMMSGEGTFRTIDAMEQGAYFDEQNQLHAVFKPIDNTKFTAYASGMTGYAYYANYELDIDPLTAGSSTTGTYLFYTVKADGETYYGTSNSRAKCTKIDTVDDNAPDFEAKYYVVNETADNQYTRIYNTKYEGTLPAEYATLIANVDPITITLAGDCVFEDVPASDNL